MIRVKCSRVPEPKVLQKRNPQGKTETERAIEWYAPNPHREDAFNFKVYRDKSVKRTLGELFHRKCAYCESKYGATQPVDVEHFRPKSAVKVDGELTRPGYYWLAADWDNLLPSCIDCNREREQEFLDSRVKVAGKANWFPVRGERVTSHERNVHKEEHRLLIHPCRDHPEKHLEFTAEGGVRHLSQKGKHSIEVFALARTGLADERKARWKRVRNQALRVMKELQRLSTNDEPQGRRDLAFEIDDLFSYAAEDAEYAGLARQAIRRAVEEFSVFARAQLSQELQDFVNQRIQEGDWHNQS